MPERCRKAGRGGRRNTIWIFDCRFLICDLVEGGCRNGLARCCRRRTLRAKTVRAPLPARDQSPSQQATCRRDCGSAETHLVRPIKNQKSEIENRPSLLVNKEL